MSNKKQSSIDWLEEEFVKLEATVGVHSVMYELIEQAKAMHEKEIIDACNQKEFEDIDGYGIHETISKGEEYYNETYGGNNE